MTVGFNKPPLHHKQPHQGYVNAQVANNLAMRLADNIVGQIAESISRNYDIAGNCLMLKGRAVIAKDSLVALIATAYRFFAHSANADHSFCQIDTLPLFNNGNRDKTRPVSVLMNTEAYYPHHGVPSVSNESNTEVSYPSDEIADLLAHSSFYVTRQFYILNLPNIYTLPFVSGSESSVYKIIDISKATYAILKTPLESTSMKLMRIANEKFRLQFYKIKALYADVQGNGLVQMQQPPLALIDTILKNKVTKACVEHFYNGGDLLDIILNPEFNQVTIPARIKICFKIADSLNKIFMKGYFNRDIKVENILVEKSANGYEPHISDYADSIKINEMFNRFENMLSQDGLTVDDFCYIDSLRATFSVDSIHARDAQSLRFIILEMVDHIFMTHPLDTDVQLRVQMLNKFREFAQKLMEGVETFALGVVIFKVLFCTYPHVKVAGHPHDTKKPLHKAQNEILFTKLAKNYPHPEILEMIQLIQEMMADDFRLRPSLSKIVQKFGQLVEIDFNRAG